MLKQRFIYNTLLVLTSVLFFGCNEKVTPEPEVDCSTKGFFDEYSSREFEMGFSTWPYDATISAVENTYQFIEENADIYSEHIDNKIPWSSWINNSALPIEFTNDLDSRVSRRINNHKLLLSISLLNGERSDLAEDYDGSIPNYTFMNDSVIEDAYFKHVQYIVSEMNPDYLVIAIEANELLKYSSAKWDEYKLLIQNVKQRIQQEFPELEISESITLHSIYQTDDYSADEVTDIFEYANNLDFVTISFYPFFKNLHNKSEFQNAFDYLHSNITKPISFSETNHIAEDLSVNYFNLFIEGDECEQNAYLETLISNAQEHNYKFIIWWAYRDYDALWETFPEDSKDLGKLWRDTGLLNEDGEQRVGYSIWQKVFAK